MSSITCEVTDECADSGKEYAFLEYKKHVMAHMKDKKLMALFEYRCSDCREAYFSDRFDMFFHQLAFPDHKIVRLNLHLDKLLKNTRLKESFNKAKILFSQNTVRRSPTPTYVQSPRYTPPIRDCGTQMSCTDDDVIHQDDRRTPTPTGDLYPFNAAHGMESSPSPTLPGDSPSDHSDYINSSEILSRCGPPENDYNEPEFLNNNKTSPAIYQEDALRYEETARGQETRRRRVEENAGSFNNSEATHARERHHLIDTTSRRSQNQAEFSGFNGRTRDMGNQDTSRNEETVDRQEIRRRHAEENTGYFNASEGSRAPKRPRRF